jgi:hypothetical protein
VKESAAGHISRLNHGGTPMPHKIVAAITSIFAISILFQAPSYSKDLSFTFLDVKKVSSYDNDRLAFQHFEKAPNEVTADKTDNSVALMMIIKDKKIYFFQDGYDNPEQVYFNKISYDQGNQYMPDIWLNKVDGIPDFVQVMDRRIEVQRSNVKEWVSSNYKDMYLNVRDKFIKKHVSIFLSLIVNRKDTDMVVTRKLLSKKLYDTSGPKFAITVSAKTNDGGSVYYAEDADGDGVTETFTVHCGDGFQWGYKSGPNVICIEKNSQKDIQQMIGRISNLAYYGSPEEEQIIKKTFPTSDKVNSMINTLYNIDPETDKMLRKNGIDLEQNVDNSSKPENK